MGHKDPEPTRSGAHPTGWCVGPLCVSVEGRGSSRGWATRIRSQLDPGNALLDGATTVPVGLCGGKGGWPGGAQGNGVSLIRRMPDWMVQLGCMHGRIRASSTPPLTHSEAAWIHHPLPP